MRAVVSCRLGEQPDELTNEYLRLVEEGHSKANRKLEGVASVTHVELVTVRLARPDGSIELNDGRVLDAGYREFVPGYAVTSYGSQGKTVDYVLFSDSTIEAATNDQQGYATISRHSGDSRPTT
jgi:hypothetical protein